MKIRSFIKLCAKIYKTKAAKVALLGVCSTMLLVSSGASFAKYYSENGFDDEANLAKLGNGKVVFNQELNQTPIGLDPAVDIGMYVFMSEFSVEFDASEVARTFDLELRMAKTTNVDYKNYDKATQTSFYRETGSASTFPTFIIVDEGDTLSSYKVPNALSIPTSAKYTINGVTSDVFFSENESNRKKWDDASKAFSNFETNKLYFAYGIESSGNVTYTWNAISYETLRDPKDPEVKNENDENITPTNIDFITDGKIGNIYDSKLGLEAKTLYFRFIFFANIDSGMKSEDTNILSKITLKQLS